jgi:hypothetical protein
MLATSSSPVTSKKICGGWKCCGTSTVCDPMVTRALPSAPALNTPEPVPDATLSRLRLLVLRPPLRAAFEAEFAPPLDTDLELDGTGTEMVVVEAGGGARLSFEALGLVEVEAFVVLSRGVALISAGA